MKWWVRLKSNHQKLGRHLFWASVINIHVITPFGAVAFIMGCAAIKEKQGSNTSFKCNVNIYSCPSVEPPAGCDAGRLALWSSACFQLASLFLTATSGLYRSLWWHQRFGLINGLQCHLSSGTSRMLIWGGVGGGGTLWGATKLQQPRVYLEFIRHSGHQGRIIKNKFSEQQQAPRAEWSSKILRLPLINS